MKILSQIARFLVGVLMIFSGLIKLNDPMGTQIKMEEYFEVFAADIAPFFEVFVPFALPIAIIMCLFEVVLGVALLIQWRMQFTKWALLGLMVFFTFLTFYSAFFNKVTDCGCFGDAIKLTPWGSFTKDIVLLVFIALIFAGYKHMKPLFKPANGNMVVVGVTALSAVAAFWALAHLPFIDFRPYKIGNDIKALMTLPPNAKKDEFVITYQMVNTKSKAAKTVTDKEYMDQKIWEDTTWQIQGEPVTKQTVVGDKPAITDFNVQSDELGDITDSVFKGNKFIVIVLNASKVYPPYLKKIAETADALSAISTIKVEPIILTASTTAEMDVLRHEAQLAAPIFQTDATVLKTIMRSNPGTWLLQDGVVKGKWHYNDTPEAGEVLELLKSTTPAPAK
jgi:uncharacterized membrane protein YphA (DoxX/SURF4 family)